MHRRSIGTRSSLDDGPREGDFLPQFRICARDRRSQHGDGAAVARAGTNQSSILDPQNRDKDAIVSENLGPLNCKLFRMFTVWMSLTFAKYWMWMYTHFYAYLEPCPCDVAGEAIVLVSMCQTNLGDSNLK